MKSFIVFFAILAGLSQIGSCGRVSSFFCTEPLSVEFKNPWNPLIEPIPSVQGSKVKVVVSFSRPIVIDWDRSKLDWTRSENTRKLSPLSFVSDLRSGDGILVPDSIDYAGHSSIKLEAEFSLSWMSQYLVLFPGPVYLVLGPSTVFGFNVVDGTIHRSYVPFTLLGVYYFRTEQMMVSDIRPQTIQSIPESLYCGFQPGRSLITKEDHPVSLSLGIMEEKGTLSISSTRRIEVHLPFNLIGQGSGTFPLPEVVVATIDDKPVRVELSSRQVNIQTDDWEVKVPLTLTTFSQQRERSFHQKPSSTRFRACPPSSTRNNIGVITVYHVLEIFGEFPLYWPELDHNLWSITKVGTRARIVVGMETNTSDWHNVITGSEQNLNIPSDIISAVKRYVFTLPTSNQPWSVVRFKPSTSLEDGVFIPREYAVNVGCGTLNITEDNFLGQEDFCNKTIGSCVGQPFYSPRRFPVIPPFGLSELGGGGDRGGFVDLSGGGDRAVLHSTEDGQHYLLLKIRLSDQQGVLTVPDVTIQEPFLYKTSSEWEDNRGVVDKETFCKAVWSLEANIHVPHKELTATLNANIRNYGQGGGSVNITVRCSELVKVYPNDGVTLVWVESGETASVLFTLSGEQAIHLPEGEHKCVVDIAMVTSWRLAWSTSGKVMPSCTFKFTTFYGAFKDPCVEPEQELPDLDVQFHFLPKDQLNKEGLKKIKSYILHNFVLIRALSMDLLIGEKQEKLVYHLHEMTISCENGDFSVFDLESILSLGVRVEGSTPLSVVYTRELAKRKFLYIFVKKDADHSRPSGCKVLVVARRPHVSCPVPVVVLDRPIVLNSADHQALQLTASNILEIIYGMQSPTILFTMVTCVVSTVILFCGVGSGHFVLLLFRKKLPSKGSLRQARRSLRDEMLLEKRKWDNPTSYLEAGPDGPYYRLYNFKATEMLDSVDLRNVKIAGMLKFKDKELQIMFGHVKKVFLQPNGQEEMCDVWIQASSGMYLLAYAEVDPTYKDDFEAVVMPKVTVISDDGESIIDGKTKTILDGEDGDSTGDIDGESKIISDEESVAAITCDEIISTGVESMGTWEDTRISVMSDDGD